MPPTSRLLAEEGAAIVSFKLVRAGEFQVGFHSLQNMRGFGFFVQESKGGGECKVQV